MSDVLDLLRPDLRDFAGYASARRANVSGSVWLNANESPWANIADADSESVEELVEEGNAFEAEAIQGVEDAGDDEVAEVTTHEVPEDDVPEEYLNDEGKNAA